MVEVIAVPSRGDSLDDYVFDHFGRAPFYLIVKVNEGEIKDLKAIRNPDVQHKHHDHSSLFQMFYDEGVNVIISGGIGRRALQELISKGIKVFPGVQGRIRDVLNSYINGDLSPISIDKLDEFHDHHGYHRRHNH